MNIITEILGYIIVSCVCLFGVYVYTYTLVDNYVLKKRSEKKEQDEMIKKHIREFREWDEMMQERTNLLIEMAVKQQKNNEKRLQEYLIKRDRLPEDYFENPEKYINMKVNK